MCVAGGLEANNRSTGTWNIYNLWQVFRAPVLLRASWMIQDSPPRRHRPNMWNCRNVKKSCMCAERKKIIKSCCRVSKSPRKKSGTARKERGRRARDKKTERREHHVTFGEMLQLGGFPPDTKLLKISIPRFWWNMSVKRDVSVLELNQAGRVLRVSRFQVHKRVCVMKRESIQPLQKAFIWSGL